MPPIKTLYFAKMYINSTNYYSKLKSKFCRKKVHEFMCTQTGTNVNISCKLPSQAFTENIIIN